MTDKPNHSIESPLLPRDVIYYEIFPRLSVDEIYSYSRSSKDKVYLCNNVEFWTNYLTEMNNDEIQRIALDAAREDNLSFIQMLLDHSDELYILIDDRTKIEAYFLFADHKDWHAVDYVRSKIEYSYGLVLNDDFGTLWSLINQIIEIIEKLIKRSRARDVIL